MLDQAQEGRVQWLVKVGNLVIAPVGREVVLDQVVGPNTEEVDFLGQVVGINGRQWHFDHHPKLDVLADPRVTGLQFRQAFVVDRLSGPQFRHRPDHWEHDPQWAKF